MADEKMTGPAGSNEETVPPTVPTAAPTPTPEAANSSNIGPSSLDYNASMIKSLDGVEHVRRRPGMYIGGYNPRGLHHLVYEIVDNSIDEALAGYAKHVEVRMNPDGSCTVTDDGRGIPVDIHPDTGLPAVEMVFASLATGGKFEHDDDSAYQTSGGLHGVGASVVNFVSEWFEVEVSRNGNVYHLLSSRTRPQEQRSENRRQVQPDGKRKSASSPTPPSSPKTRAAPVSSTKPSPSACASWRTSTRASRSSSSTNASTSRTSISSTMGSSPMCAISTRARTPCTK